MKTKKSLVNLVLMSIVTVAASFSFTACSDDLNRRTYHPSSCRGLGLYDP